MEETKRCPDIFTQLMCKPFEQMYGASGLYRYTGDPVHLRLKLVLTDPVIIENRPSYDIIHGSTNHVEGQDTDKNTNNQNHSISVANTSRSSLYRAAYVLKKSTKPHSQEWDVELEEVTDLPSSGYQVDDRRPSLAVALEQCGFKLKVLSLPLSRTSCHSCRKARMTILKDKLFPLGGLRCENLKTKKNSAKLPDSTNRSQAPTSEHMVRASSESYSSQQFEHDHRSELIVENLFYKRRRAFSWKDTLNENSVDDYNDRCARTLRSRVVVERHTRANTVNQSSASLLMRNHHRSHYGPCHSSRMSVAQHFNTRCNHDENPSFQGSLRSRQDNIERNAHHDLDNCGMEEQNQATTSRAIASCHRSDTTRIKYCSCRYGCLTEDYKRWLRFNRRHIINNRQDAPKSPRNVFITDDLSRSSKPGEAKEDEQYDNDLVEKDDDSRSFNLLLDALDLNCLDESIRGDKFELDLSRMNSSNIHNQNSSRSGIESIEQEWKRIVATTTDVGLQDSDSICSESHEEILCVIMEKYLPVPDEEPSEFIGASNVLHHISSSKATQKIESQIGPDKSVTSELIYDKKSESVVINFTDQKKSKQELPSEDPTIQECDQRRPSLNDLTVKPLGAASGASLNNDLSTSVGGSMSNKESLADATHLNQMNKRHTWDRDDGLTIKSERLNYPARNTNAASCMDKAQQRQWQQQRQQPQSIIKEASETAQDDIGNDYTTDTVTERGLAEREYSILLAVIVIDKFSKIVEMKPDLNKLITIDLRDFVASSGYSDETRDTVSDIVNSRLVFNHDGPIHQTLSKRDISRLFYHVESIPTTDAERYTLNEQLDIVRHRIEAVSEACKIMPKYELNVLSSHATMKQEMIRGVLTPFDGRVLVLLQFNVHYASGLPADCKDIHVKYKLFARDHRYWRFRTCHDMSVGLLDQDHQSKSAKKEPSHSDEVGAASSSSLLKHVTSVSNARTKLIHTIDSQKTPRASFNTADDHSIVYDSPRGGKNLFETDLSGHDKFTSEERHKLDTLNVDKESSLILIGEGSTVTSRQNNLGSFHLCCAEQIALELSKKTKSIEAYSDSDDTAQANAAEAEYTYGANGCNEIITEIKRQKPAFAEIGRDNKIDEQSDTLASFPPDNLGLSPQDSRGYGSPTKILSSLKDRDNINLGTIEKPVSTKPVVSSIGGLECSRVSQVGHDAKDTIRAIVRTDMQSNDFDCYIGKEVGDITLVVMFEVYSTDFYRDKLQGWSSVHVPVTVDHRTQLEASERVSFSNNNNASNKCRFKKLELPIMRPTFSAPIDKLRYYLTGRLPCKAPPIESFFSSTNRYLMQAEENGKLVIDYQILKQFSDVKLDRALRELISSNFIMDNRT